ncbi:SHOCT domain-containing protein [Nonomuraea endophytica]|uniref:Regulator of protease activity HflC (Stomatin/prohibitin superfamily) n=1 Tax=Nonomuraea endophytica TaxID=714136 RepID=A0A7W8A9A4_9ACTN|nr:SHOCT domain-containing protein [Nonomuraea endophytica]MBB5082006.1 regulator of protease activity HflC (stomatin/prohibitin superfamily) [Nonomuraea endophytica]
MMLRRRVGRPGLIGAMARTAVITGTATAVSGGIQRRQARRMEEQEAAAAAQQQSMVDRATAQAQADRAAQAQPQAPSTDPAERMRLLRELGQMKADGLLTEEEFAAEKARILAS